MRDITTIIVHCTATMPGHDVDIDDVRRWHVSGNNWTDVGYHALIKLDGTIEHGRSIHKQGAGVKGHNKNSVHVCYVGGLGDDTKPADTMNADQVRALYAYVTGFVKVMGAMEVIGHNDLTEKKACPSFKVAKKFPELVAWACEPKGEAPAPLQAPQQSVRYCRKCSRQMVLRGLT